MTGAHIFALFVVVAGLILNVHFYFKARQLFKDADRLAEQARNNIDRFRELLRTLDEINDV